MGTPIDAQPANTPSDRYEVAWQHRRLAVTPSGLTLSEHDKVLAQFALSDIEAIYEVTAGSDIHANDYEFTVFVFAKQCIAVPADFCFSVSRPFDALAAQLDAAPKLWRYSTLRVPFSWRAWRWNPLGSPSVKLACYERPVLDACVRNWHRVRGPRTLSDYQNAEITQQDNADYQRRFWAAAYKEG